MDWIGIILAGAATGTFFWAVGSGIVDGQRKLAATKADTFAKRLKPFVKGGSK